MPKVTFSPPVSRPPEDALYFQDTTDDAIYVIGESEDSDLMVPMWSLVAIDGTSRSYGYRFPTLEAARANALSRHDLRPIPKGTTITIEV